MLKKSLLIAALVLSVPAASAFAGSQSTVSVNGKTIKVNGGSSLSVSSVNGHAVVSGSGIEMELDGSILTMSGKSVDLGSFHVIEVTLVNGDPSVEVDGRRIFE